MNNDRFYPGGCSFCTHAPVCFGPLVTCGYLLRRCCCRPAFCCVPECCPPECCVPECMQPCDKPAPPPRPHPKPDPCPAKPCRRR